MTLAEVFLAPVRDCFPAQVAIVSLLILIFLDCLFGVGTAIMRKEFSSKKMREGWHPEGVPFFSNAEGTPVFRLYNSNSGEHFYTVSEGERDNLRNAGWDYEGVSFHVAKG